jgi:hypothetical protein
MTAGESTSYHTPFGIEVDRRESHLAALPGKRAYEWFESLRRATEVFNGNTVELQRHLTQFVGTMIHVNDLPDGFDVEANRLLHNYVAAMASLRDIQRAIHRQLWPEPIDEDDDHACPTCGRRGPKRTKWQVTVWEPQVAKEFGDDPIRFLADLRNFSMHYSIPPVTLTTRWHSEGGGPMEWQNIVALKRDELLKYSGWSGAARRYIDAHDGDIEFLPVIVAYSTRVRAFAEWFWRLVEDEVRTEMAEYIGKNNEYIFWRHVEGTVSRYGPDGRRIQYRKTAEARLKRAENGTSGWRRIAPDENGEWVVGESDWPPLPRGPR